MNYEGTNLDAVKIVQSLLAHADARTTEQYLESIDIPSLDALQPTRRPPLIAGVVP